VAAAVFAAKYAARRHVGKERFGLISVRGKRDDVAARQSLVARTPVPAAVVAAQHADPGTRKIQHPLATRRNRYRRDVPAPVRRWPWQARPIAALIYAPIEGVGRGLEQRTGRGVEGQSHDFGTTRRRSRGGRVRRRQSCGERGQRRTGQRARQAPPRPGHHVIRLSYLIRAAYLARVSPIFCMISACIWSCSFSLPGGS